MTTQQRDSAKEKRPHRLQVALFVTCLADLMRPSVGFASIRLLERAGCDVTVPLQQTCCGQAAYNSGDREAAIPVAQQLIETFDYADYVVIPSGSCAGMIVHHYPKILGGSWRDRALEMAAKTFELTQFLHEVTGMRRPTKTPRALPPVTYHDSCAGLRELGIKAQPRELLKTLRNCQVTEMQDTEVCCGFGGTFCAKMPDISLKMTDDKLQRIQDSKARILTGGDLGCLLAIAGRAKRLGQNIEVRHIAELLAGDLRSAAIGEGEEQR